MSKTLSELYVEIKTEMDLLESYMNNEAHLSEPDKVTELLEKLSLKWTFMSEEDKDFVQTAEDALKTKRSWK